MVCFRTRVEQSSSRPSNVERVVAALRELQATLHILHPGEKTEVRAEMPFATSEWLDGLALSCRPRDNEGSTHLVLRNIDETSTREAVASQGARLKLTPNSVKLVIVLVGLPARGKSLLGHALERFLSWKGSNTRLFSVGNRRRELASSTHGPERRPETGTASFFDSKKAYASQVRETVSLEIFDEVLDWLTNEGGHVAIFDAANVSIQRRAKLHERASKRSDGGLDEIAIVFLESIVTDPEVIQAGLDWKVAQSADFRGMSHEAAMADLLTRVRHYEEIYETVRAEEGAYIKLFNLSATAHCRNIYGRMSRSVLPFLLSIHAVPRSIFLLAIPTDAPPSGQSPTHSGSIPSGSSEKTFLSRSLTDQSWPHSMGGMLSEISDLISPKSSKATQELQSLVRSADEEAIGECRVQGESPQGRQPMDDVTARLVRWAEGREDSSEIRILTSTLPHAVATATALAQAANAAPPSERAQLAPLGHASDIPSTREDFDSKFGERVANLVGRLEPVALEIEASTQPLLIVAHEASVRALRSFLLKPSSALIADREFVDASFDVSASTLLEFFPSPQGGYGQRVHQL